MDQLETTLAVGSAKIVIGLLDNLLKQAKPKEKKEIEKAKTELYNTQGIILNIQQDLFRLQDENQRLKKQIEEYDNWEKKAEEYKLVKTKGNARVYQYTGKEEVDHYLCPNCFNNKKKGILQDTLYGGNFRCSLYDKTFRINFPEQPKPIQMLR